MSGKYNFILKSDDRQRDLPPKLIIGQHEAEPVARVLLKFLAFLFFYRERLQIEPQLHNDNIPFVPDLAQLDYELRPVFWVECGDCGTSKLNKLAVKMPDAEIWIIKRSPAEAEHLFQAMAKAELRRGHYGLLGLDPEMFDEMVNLLAFRNEVYWVAADFEEGNLQFDFNGLWFDAPFKVLKY